MPGEDHIHPIFLEQCHVFSPGTSDCGISASGSIRIFMEIEVIIFFIDALTDYRAVKEHEDVFVAAGFPEFPFQPLELLFLSLFLAVFDAVGVKADEGAAAQPEGESFIASRLKIVGVIFRVPRADVVIAGDFIHRCYYLSSVGHVDGILQCVIGIVDEVSGNDHALGTTSVISGIDRGKGVDRLNGPAEKRVGLPEAWSGVPEPDLRVCHLDESELRKPGAARCQKAKSYE